jgi:uncharacterized protein (TIGR03790 family)
VVVNSNSAESVALGNYYLQKRGIPQKNLIRISISTKEMVSEKELEADIVGPLRKALNGDLKDKIDYIVLCKGVPIRVEQRGPSVDSCLVSLDLEDARRATGNTSGWSFANPYYNANEPFTREKYKMYLVTRLDGYTFEEARRLVDNALAAKPNKGPFYFDADPTKDGNPGYATGNDSLRLAAQQLSKAGFDVTLENSEEFGAPLKPLAGYCSWGSNDKRFSAQAYKRLRFLPGALAETYVSTSARSFEPQGAGQSVITDLIAGGVTGIKGYVDEPGLEACAKPSILFPRYTAGFNLAESFYAASKAIRWKDIVIGDPLCRPYRSP